MKRMTSALFLKICGIILCTLTSTELFYIYFTHSPFPVSPVLVLIGAWFFAVAALASILRLILALRKPDR